MLKRPRPRFLMTLFSLSALLILLLAACGAPQGGGGGTGTGGTAVKGGTWINDLYEEPDSLIPNAADTCIAVGITSLELCSMFT